MSDIKEPQVYELGDENENTTWCKAHEVMGVYQLMKERIAVAQAQLYVGEHDASRKYEARIAELEQELIDQADQHAKILAPILSPKYRHQGCAIAQRACSSGCPYWEEFADTFVTSKAPKP